MAIICDRSPCDRLLRALGKYIFGALSGRTDVVTLEVLTPGGHDTAVISYCPFCGTRLDEIGPGLLEKFLPKKPAPQQLKIRGVAKDMAYYDEIQDLVPEKGK